MFLFPVMDQGADTKGNGVNTENGLLEGYSGISDSLVKGKVSIQGNIDEWGLETEFNLPHAFMN